jgi:1,4-dihydroxy-2-naphthoyl-CoA synthase|tara:strand:- start:2641 stop:2904 length:264 start_codon:yes stop_codon:yes gene_type:complete
MMVNSSECQAAGLDPAEVAKIARGLSRYAKQAQALGVKVFGGGAGGQLRFCDGGTGDLILADLDGDFDGGDGATGHDADGLLRGEYV